MQAPPQTPQPATAQHVLASTPSTSTDRAPSAEELVADGWREGAFTALRCPYEEKHIVHALGAKWDARKRTWYITPNQSAAPFARWLHPPIYLSASFDDKDGVKALGAGFDAAAKKWYVPVNRDPRAFTMWLPADFVMPSPPPPLPTPPS